MPQDYGSIVRSLKEHRVEFIIIGGMAAVTLGAPIVTQDFDICYKRTKENAERLATALKPFHPKLRGVSEPLPFKLDGETIFKGCNFTFTTDAGDLDVFGHVIGLGGFGEIARSAETLPLYGMDVLCMSLEDLIKAKKAAGRQKDKAQLSTLEATLKERKKTKPQ